MPVAALVVAAALQFARPTRSLGEGHVLLAEHPMVLRLAGEVWVARRAQGQPIAITDAATVTADDRFLTGDDGRAVLVWPQGTVLAIEPRSRVQLAGGGSDRQQVWLDAGEVWLAGGEGAAERAVVIRGDEGLRAEGVRLRARRVAGDGLQVLTYDAPAWLTGGGRTQLVPRNAESQASSNRVPTLPRPLPDGRALAVRVAGAGGWAVVDRAGRATGQLPGASSWVGAIPGSSQPLRDGAATTVVLPATPDGLRLILWGAGAPRQVEVTAWATDLAATIEGRTAPPEAAARIREPLDANAVVVLALAGGEGAAVLSRSQVRGTTLPADLRLLAPAGPRPVAAQIPPTVRAAPSPVPPEGTVPEEKPGDEGRQPPAALAASPSPTPSPEAPQPTTAAPTAAPASEPSAAPSATAIVAPARFERHAVEFAPPAPSPTLTVEPRTIVVAPPPSPVPTGAPTQPAPTVAPRGAPTAPPITVGLPTLPPTPLLPTLAPPTAPPARPTAGAAPANRGPSPVVPGAPPSGAPPGGLGINAWGGVAGGGGTPSGGASTNAAAPPGPSGQAASTGSASAPASTGGRAGPSGGHP